MDPDRSAAHHLRTFYLLTVTQVLSIIGSIMTHIAVGIRVFGDTGESTPLLTASFFSALPLMVGGLFAGALADRWNRRRALIASDALQAVGTLMLLLSFASGQFRLWHLYAVSLLQGTLGMLQRPAMEASVTMLVPEGHRDRANAMRQITGPAAGMIAPLVTGFVYALVGAIGVMIVDLLTFAVAIAVVSLVQIPQPRPSDVRPGSALRAPHTDMQGRVFALLFQLMYIANPLALLLTGPLVDRLLEPAVGGPRWAAAGRGAAWGAGALIFLLTACVYAWPRMRSIERDLPDYAAVADS